MGETILYMILKKALYGTLKAFLLFWRMLKGALEEWGFEINPYDWCVANKTINGEPCSFLWHDYDLKFSHVDPVVVSDIIDPIRKEFGKAAPFTKTSDYPWTTAFNVRSK
jgi:hypothetical protein